MFNAFLWEQEVMLHGKKPVDLQEYLNHRIQSIATYPYIEVWRLLLGIEYPEVSKGKISTSIDTLSELTCKIIYLANDIVSVNHDKSRNRINILNFFKEERDHHSKIMKIKWMHDQSLEEYLHLIEDMRKYNDNQEQLITFMIEITQTCIWGSYMSIQDLHERYIGL